MGDICAVRGTLHQTRDAVHVASCIIRPLVGLLPTTLECHVPLTLTLLGGYQHCRRCSHGAVSFGRLGQEIGRCDVCTLRRCSSTLCAKTRSRTSVDA